MCLEQLGDDMLWILKHDLTVPAWLEVLYVKNSK